MGASPDSFYLGFACHGCREPIEIIIDDGSEHCRFVAEDVLQIRCLQCQYQGHYKTADVRRYPGRAPSTLALAIAH
jgi:hypothetical protein